MAPVTRTSPLQLLPPAPEDLQQISPAYEPSAPDLPHDFLLLEKDTILPDQRTHELYIRDPEPAMNKILTARQQTQPIIVPATYMGSNPGANSGEIVGIVLGVVLGVSLVLWILSSLRTNPLRPVIGTSSVTDVGRYRSDRAEQQRSRTAKTKSSGRRTARSRSKSAVSRDEMSEVQAPPPRRERGNSGRSPRRARETIIVEESRRENRPPPPEEYDDDVVEVIEEESDFSAPPRQRRMSGYRNDDGYGGGPRSIRSMRR